MEWLVGSLLLAGSFLTATLLVRRWTRRVGLPLRDELARAGFRQRREWLEVEYLDLLFRVDPIERLRWEEARWHDEVVWARDRRTGRLLALVGVHFDEDPHLDLAGHPPRRATVLFEYHRGFWRADGRWFDEIHPHEALLRHGQFEPIALPPARQP